MEDDEEYAYSDYSADTARNLVHASVKEDGEELSYTGYGDDVHSQEKENTPYGDFLIEEFSSEVNVPRISKLTKIPQEVVSYVFCALYLIVGVMCVSITSQVQGIIPYIVGGVMAAIGVLRFVLALARKEYRTVKTNQTASSLIFVALGIMIIAESEWAISFISIVWGILGLMEAARALNHTFSRLSAGERCIHHVIKGIVEGVLAFMLLYEPNHHITLHIIVFGVQLIIDAFYMAPFIKRRFSMD